jgi:hypothetical protein
MIKILSKQFILLLLAFVVYVQPAFAVTPTLLGVSTDGTVYQIDTKSGTLTSVGGEQVHNFNLGGIARNPKYLYYIAAPSGSTENSIYTLNLKTNVFSHIDLNRPSGDDDVRVMFLKGNKLYAIFYNGNLGTAGLFQINPNTGAVTPVVDLSSLNVEPITGAFTTDGTFYYVLVKPETDSTKRQIMKFQINNKVPTFIDVLAKDGTSVLCDRFKLSAKSGSFVCLASITSSSVAACKVSTKGLTTCGAPITNIERLAGGHTMLSPDGTKYYAIVYELGDQNSQRLIQITSKGGIKSKATINSILVGAQFSTDSVPLLNLH